MERARNRPQMARLPASGTAHQGSRAAGPGTIGKRLLDDTAAQQPTAQHWSTFIVGSAPEAFGTGRRIVQQVEYIGAQLQADRSLRKAAEGECVDFECVTDRLVKKDRRSRRAQQQMSCRRRGRSARACPKGCCERLCDEADGARVKIRKQGSPSSPTGSRCDS